MVFFIFEALCFVAILVVNVYSITVMAKNKALIEKYNNKIAVEDVNNKIHLIWAFIFGIQSFSGFMQSFSSSEQISVEKYGYLLQGISMLFTAIIFILTYKKTKFCYITDKGIIQTNGLLKCESCFYRLNGDILEIYTKKTQKSVQYRITENFKAITDILHNNFEQYQG